MANVRCPMCSKLNPPDAEACSYCGARLKPLRSSSGSPPAGVPAGNKPGDSDAPDWLSSLRTDEPQQEDSSGSAPSEQGQSDQEMPDWLSRIRSRATSEPGETSVDPSQPQDDSTDWMKDLSGSSGSGQESGTGWLRRLAGDQPDEPSPGELPDSQKEEPVQPLGEDDWLNKLADWNTPAEQAPAGQVPAGQAPQTPWDEQEKPRSPAAPEPAEEDFSWLSSFAQDSGAPANEPAAEESEGFGLTSFLSSFDEPPADQPPSDPTRVEPDRSPADSSGFGLTGFLTNLENPPSEEPEQVSQSEGLPDWLSAEQPAAQEAAEPEIPAFELPEQELPKSEEPADLHFTAWLQSMESGRAAEEQPEQPQSDQPETGAGWLSDLPFLESSEETPAGSGEPSSDLPPWLEGAEPLPAQPEKPAGEDSDLPSWLAGFGESTPPAPPVEEAPQPGEEKNLPSWVSMESGDIEPPALAESETQPAENLPDWFSSFEQAPAEQSMPEQEPAEQSAAAGDVPEWLRDFDAHSGTSTSMPPLIEAESPLVPSPAMEGDQPFAVDLPEWLAEDAAARSAEGSEQPAEPVSEELAQADLPEWVKEMRPIESIIPGETQMPEAERHAERSGPLAGMNGILQAEELVYQYKKPPVYSIKLRVTEKQRGQSSQLDTILAQETQPLMIPPQAKRVQGLLLRVLIAVLILGVLIAPPLLGMNPLAMPMLSPGESEQMFDQIENSLQENAPVLLAVDFEPAFYGEMKLSALPVVDHLMAQNARIVVVSTRPAGPALAEQLLSEAARQRSAFDLAEQTINLGYLPGDMISLLEFARQPAFAAPAALNGEYAWDKPILQGVTNMQDFAQVIVITDTAETGRAWVEQVQPLMGETPLMMVTSAQAGPMMAPFVESNQIDGMVSGLLGGVMYAQRTQQETPATSYLASYQIGTLLAFGLTLVGAVISGGMALFKREDKDED